MTYHYAAFVAVNSGYDVSKNHTSDTVKAVEIVSGLLEKSNELQLSVTPAVVVWSTQRGCQQGGSPCPLVEMGSDQHDSAVTLFKQLQDELNLMTVRVTGDNPELGVETVTLSMEVRGQQKLSDVAVSWQDRMEQFYTDEQIEVSAGIIQLDDSIVIQSTINPSTYTKDKWNRYEEIFCLIAQELYRVGDVNRTTEYCLYLNNKPK